MEGSRRSSNSKTYTDRWFRTFLASISRSPTDREIPFLRIQLPLPEREMDQGVASIFQCDIEGRIGMPSPDGRPFSELKRAVILNPLLDLVEPALTAETAEVGESLRIGRRPRAGLVLSGIWVSLRIDERVHRRRWSSVFSIQLRMSLESVSVRPS